MTMSAFYEFAKQFDVVVIFAVLYGIGLGGIVYWIMESLHWCWKKLKQHWEKKHKMKKQSEE